MAQRNRPTIAIDMFRITRDAKGAQHRQHLGGKGFVDFDHIEIGNPQAQSAKQFFSRRHRADAH